MSEPQKPNIAAKVPAVLLAIDGINALRDRGSHDHRQIHNSVRIKPPVDEELDGPLPDSEDSDSRSLQ